MLLRILRIHSAIQKIKNIDQEVPSENSISQPSKTNKNLLSLLSSIYPDGINGGSNLGSNDQNEENDDTFGTGALMEHDESGIITSAKVPFVSQVNLTTPSPGQHPLALPFSREK